MPDFNVRSDSVNVEQIMEQIRSRIREKRGVDYTEQQIREMAAVKLERFLDPRGVRSDLIEQFKRQKLVDPRGVRSDAIELSTRQELLDPRGVRSDLIEQSTRQQASSYEPPLVPSYTFEATTIFETHRWPLRLIRKLLRPILKLFFNPNALIHALHSQAEINRLALEREVNREISRETALERLRQDRERRRQDREATRERLRQDRERRRQDRERLKQELEVLTFEVLHNLVIELTRTGIEVKNLKMRVESVSSRLDFNERRARALESVVVYRPAAEESAPAPPPAASAAPGAPAASGDDARQHEPATAPEGPGQRSRRRRRRRGRRSGASATAVMGGTVSAPQSAAAAASAEGSFDLRQDAAGDASGAHDASTASGHGETAESMEQAIAVESHPHEGYDESSSNGPQGQDPDQQ
jgi:hypothetical protein